MSRVFGLLLVGWIAVAMTGCVGPMGAGCCGPMGGQGLCDTGCAGGDACGGCNSCTGCGELYIDPWINHPADCVDPCDGCGNYNGQSCGKCRSIFSGVASLWGYRCGCDPAPVALSDRCFAPSCGADCGGCDSCAVEPACGCEGPCGCGVVAEPVCGLEPACGCEPACASPRVAASLRVAAKAVAAAVLAVTKATARCQAVRRRRRSSSNRPSTPRFPRVSKPMCRREHARSLPLARNRHHAGS